jgi:hypothetical protein
MGMHVVVIGNPIDGFRVVGPFKTSEDAFQFEEGVDESCWSMPLEAPEAVESTEA